MENIKKYLNNLIEKKEEISTKEFKKVILADYLSSGIMTYENDSVAPFVSGASLIDTLTTRATAGQRGKIAVEKLNKFKTIFVEDKKKDKTLNYAFGAKFNDVGDISKTYALFLEAVKGLGEVSRDNVFTAPSKNKISKVLTPYESLIDENMVRFADMFEEKFGSKDLNKDAVASVATILLLKAIAQEGEEKNIDKLAEQIHPFLFISIMHADKKYLGDKKIYDIAEEFVAKRITEINNGLNRKAIVVDIATLRADKKLGQEINKRVNENEFKNYQINFYTSGSNKLFGYIAPNGEIKNCNITDADFVALEDIDSRLIEDSVIDTAEEVLSSMLANLIVVENSTRYNTTTKKQITMACALPLVQAMNALGDDKANEIMKETLVKLAKMHKEEKDNAEEKGPFEILEFENKALEKYKPKAIKKDENAVVENQEVVEIEKPKKEITVEGARKTFYKKIFSENNKFYKAIKNGTAKIKDEKITRFEDTLAINGLLGFEKETLLTDPATFVNSDRISHEPANIIIREFAQVYMIEKADEVVKNQEDIEERIKSLKKEIAKFYTTRVKKGQISMAQIEPKNEVQAENEIIKE